MKNIILCSALCLGVAVAHMGMVHPPPRSTALTQTSGGACGAQTGQFSGFPVTQLTPGQTLNVILNPIPHSGCNYRIALSQVGQDVYDCVLLDHAPQVTTSSSAYLTIPITVPDVDCSNCAIQAIMVSPSGTCCDFNAGSCGTTWYACANVQINGKTARNQLKCSEPCKWAYRDEKPSVYNSMQTNAVWISTGGTNFTLNVTGGYYPPSCQKVNKTVCPVTTTTGASDNGQSKNSNASFVTGGKMSAGGIIGIVVILLVVIGIVVTYFVALRNKRVKAPIMGENYTPQAIVSVEGDMGSPTTGTYTSPKVPPPPPPPRN